MEKENKGQISAAFLGSENESLSRVLANLEHFSTHRNTSPLSRFTKWESDLQDKWNFFPLANSFSLSLSDRHLHLFYEACYPSTVRIISRLMSFVDVVIAIISAKLFDYNDNEHFQSLLGTHLLLAKNLGVKNVVFLVDHMETIDYNETMFSTIVEKAKGFAMTYGIQSSLFVPISSKYSENIVKSSSLMSWWKGYCLLDAIMSFSSEIDAERLELEKKPFRFMNQRSIRIRGIGTVMLGKILSGKYVKDELLTVDNGISARTRSAEVKSTNRDEIRAGEIAGIQISNVSIRDIATGAIVAQGTPLSRSSWAEATIVIMNTKGKYGISVGFSGFFISHSARATCRISFIISKVKKGSSIEERKPKCLHYGDTARVHIRLMGSVHFDPNMGIEQLSQFVILNENEVAAYGKVEKCFMEKKTHEAATMRALKFYSFPRICNIAPPVKEEVGPFPPEILSHIFSFMEYYNLNVFTGVNRTWYGMIARNNKYWKEISLSLSSQTMSPEFLEWRVLALAYHSVLNPKCSSHKKQKKLISLINKGKEQEAWKLLHFGVSVHFFKPGRLEDCMRKIKLPGLLEDFVLALNNSLV